MSALKIRLLSDLMRRPPEDQPIGEYDYYESYAGEYRWSAGSQLVALKAFLGDRVEFLFEATTGGYQGDHYAVFRVKDDGRYVLWRDSYGSCSGCDGLDGSSMATAEEHVKASLAEGNTRQFADLAEARDYLRATKDYFWSDYDREQAGKLLEWVEANA